MTSKKGDAPVNAAANKPAAPALTLEEFCKRLSQEKNRVELIGGFYHVEKRAGRVRDTEQAYRDRFNAFKNQPA